MAEDLEAEAEAEAEDLAVAEAEDLAALEEEVLVAEEPAEAGNGCPRQAIPLIWGN